MSLRRVCVISANWVTFPEFVDLGVVLAGSRRRLVFCQGLLRSFPGPAHGEVGLVCQAHAESRIQPRRVRSRTQFEVVL